MYIGRKQLVLPVECIKIVLHTAHENPVAGHLSHEKTFAKIATHVFWPGVGRDVLNYCRSCDSCQRMSERRTKPVPLLKMPIIEIPFSRIAMDIVGPLNPASSAGHKYILTVLELRPDTPFLLIGQGNAESRWKVRDLEAQHFIKWRKNTPAGTERQITNT